MNGNSKIEDYMKTVYLLREKGAVRGAYIAKELGVTKPTVSVSLKEMEQEGYLRILSDRTVELTGKGEQIAQSVVERDAVIFELLTDLGVDGDIAAEDSGKIGHIISDESLRAFCELKNYLGYIRSTPFGKSDVQN